MEDFGGRGHLIFRRTKVASVVTENPKGGSLKTLDGLRGGATKFVWKMGGSRKSSNVIRGVHFSEVTFKGGIGSPFTLFRPKSYFSHFSD